MNQLFKLYKHSITLLRRILDHQNVPNFLQFYLSADRAEKNLCSSVKPACPAGPCYQCSNFFTSKMYPPHDRILSGGGGGG